MSSLLPGYEYDIFISYRQKDNKGDRWVTEFVKALKTELEATFKEDITIYFDENPHDGLQEHHDVDDSLREKLKCLVFIPIVSRTYCDPKSFAWEHEFRAFVSQAGQDPFGLKVKLPNGNVAGRVLPVRIHELDSEDIKLVEAELQSVLRPIDFVFKSTGVNRPLLPADKKEENAHHTYYRDQINKVANAIREIVQSMRQPQPAIFPSGKNASVQKEPKSGRRISRREITIVASFLVLLTAVFFMLKQPVRLKDPGTSGVAILPFRNNTGLDSMKFIGIGMASEIRTKLSMSKQFNVISSLQATLQYVNSTKSPQEIGEDLHVDFIISGGYQIAGRKIKVDAELIDASSGQSVWVFPFESDLTDVFQLQSDIANKVLGRFSRNPTESSGTMSTSSLEAYKHFTRGQELYLKADDTLTWSAYQPAISEFETAIVLDSGYIDAWVNLIECEAYIILNEPNDKARELKVKGYVDYFDSHFPQAWQRKLVHGIYAYRVLHDYNTSISALEEVLEHDPQNIFAIGTLSFVYKRQLNFNKAIHYKKKALDLAPEASALWKDLAQTITMMGDGKNTRAAYLKAWHLDHLKRDARGAVFASVEYGLPLNELPKEIRERLGSWYDYYEQVANRNWAGASQIALRVKDPYYAAEAYWALDKRDSARFWGKKFQLLTGTTISTHLWVTAKWHLATSAGHLIDWSKAVTT